MSLSSNIGHLAEKHGEQNKNHVAFFALSCDYFLMFLFLLTYSNNTIAQENLIKLDSLNQSVKNYYNLKLTSDLNEFDFSEKGEGLKLLPSVGMSFGQPSINWNLGQLVNFGRNKRMKKAKLKSIMTAAELAMNERINKVKIAYSKLELFQQKLSYDLDEFDLIEKLHLIDLEAFGKNEMSPQNFYESKLSFLKSVNKIEELKLAFDLKVLELKQLAFYGMSSESIFYDEYYGCILEKSN